MLPELTGYSAGKLATTLASGAIDLIHESDRSLMLKARQQNDIRGEAGSASAEVVVVSRDITARNSSEQTTGVLDTGSGAMIIVGANHLISLVDTQAERLFGYDRDELIGQSPDMLIPE